MKDFAIAPVNCRMRLLESPHENAAKMGDGLRRIHRLASVFCRGKGLDVGFGHADMQPFPGATGVDLGVPGTEHAMDLSQYAAGAYDYVFSSHCMEHVPDPEKAVVEFLRVLRPGGTLFLYLPYPGHYGWDPQFHPGKEIHKHQWQPEPSSVSRLLMLGGFRVRYAEWEKDHLHSFVVVGEKTDGAA